MAYASGVLSLCPLCPCGDTFESSREREGSHRSPLSLVQEDPIPVPCALSPPVCPCSCEEAPYQLVLYSYFVQYSLSRTRGHGVLFFVMQAVIPLQYCTVALCHESRSKTVQKYSYQVGGTGTLLLRSTRTKRVQLARRVSFSFFISSYSALRVLYQRDSSTSVVLRQPYFYKCVRVPLLEPWVAGAPQPASSTVHVRGQGRQKNKTYSVLANIDMNSPHIERNFQHVGLQDAAAAVSSSTSAVQDWKREYDPHSVSNDIEQRSTGRSLTWARRLGLVAFYWGLAVWM